MGTGVFVVMAFYKGGAPPGLPEWIEWLASENALKDMLQGYVKAK